MPSLLEGGQRTTDEWLVQAVAGWPPAEINPFGLVGPADWLQATGDNSKSNSAARGIRNTDMDGTFLETGAA